MRRRVLLAILLLTGCAGGSTSAPSMIGAASAPATVYAFAGTSSPQNDGAEPKGTLTLVQTNGTPTLYGRTAVGGNGNCGIIFSSKLDGTGYTVLYRFAGADGCSPRHDAMIFDPAANAFFSTTQGQNQVTKTTYGNQGQIFTFTPGKPIVAPISAIHVFTGPDGAQQHSSFSTDPISGIFYGQTAEGGTNGKGALYAVAPSGAGFIDLHDFSDVDGSEPHGRIVLLNGVLWGIAREGGPSGFGSVFSYTLTSPPANNGITLIHPFTGGAGNSALSDHGYLTPVSVGGKTIFFGMTQCGGGGAASDCAGHGDGAGTIFQIDPGATPGTAATYNLVHAFGTLPNDGAEPYGSLMYDGAYLYGTTSAGGRYGFGTVFRFAPVPFGVSITPQIIYNFGGSSNDGEKPIDNVIESNGFLYGMTVYGGAAGASPDDSHYTGSGTIFAIRIP